MNMKEIGRITEDIYNQKLTKRAAENTVLDGCADDLSDVSFKLGSPSMDIALLKLAVVLLAVFGGRFMWRRLPVEAIGFGSPMIIKTVMIIVVASLALFCLIFLESKKARISVRQKTLYYNNKSYDVKEISHIILKAMGRIQIFPKGKVIAKASQADDNAEILIAWAKKCRINMIEAYQRCLTGIYFFHDFRNLS